MTRQGETFSETFYPDMGAQTEWRYRDSDRERAWRRNKVAETGEDTEQQQPEAKALTREEFEQAQRARIIAQGERMSSPFWATPGK